VKDDVFIETLNTMLPAEFEEFLFVLSQEANIPQQYLIPPSQPRATRTIELIQYLYRAGTLSIAKQLAAKRPTSLSKAPTRRALPEIDEMPSDLLHYDKSAKELVVELEQLLLEKARRLKINLGRRDAQNRLQEQIDDLAREILNQLKFDANTVIAGAKLIQHLGSGNFGTIWLATRCDTGELVAVKVFHIEKLQLGSMLWRFRRSIIAMDRLTRDTNPSPSIVRLIQATDHGLAFSMQYLPNGNLENINHRGWSLEKKIDVFLEVCEAVSYAHDRGIIHRDIKPGNILLDENHKPVLTDFDIADIRFVTNTSVITGGLGTPIFAAPEQIKEEFEVSTNDSQDFKARIRSDIYSLGRLFHFLLLEQSPGYQIEPDPSLPELTRNFPSPLVNIVRRATQYDPRKRFATVAELATEVRQYQKFSSRVNAELRSSIRWLRRNAALLCISVIISAGILIFGLYQRRMAKEKEILIAQLHIMQDRLDDLQYQRDTNMRKIDELRAKLDELKRIQPNSPELKKLQDRLSQELALQTALTNEILNKERQRDRLLKTKQSKPTPKQSDLHCDPEKDPLCGAGID
jgi:serine/threonine protein kinase